MAVDFDGETTSRHKISTNMIWYSSRAWSLSIRIVCDLQSSGCRQPRSGEETLQIFQNAKAFTQQEVDDKIMPMLMHEDSSLDSDAS